MSGKDFTPVYIHGSSLRAEVPLVGYVRYDEAQEALDAERDRYAALVEAAEDYLTALDTPLAARYSRSLALDVLRAAVKGPRGRSTPGKGEPP